MESIAYLITNRFALVAFDGNVSLSMGDDKIELSSIKKAYKVNDTTIVSIVGDLKKMTKLYNYILELCKLNKTLTPKQLMKDLEFIAPKGFDELNVIVKEVIEAQQKIMDTSTTDVEKQILNEKLGKRLKELEQEIAVNPTKANMNSLHIINYSKEDGFNGLASNVSGQYNLICLDYNKTHIVKDDFLLMLYSSHLEADKLKEIRNKYVEKFKERLPKGWEDSGDLNDIIHKCKWLFTYALGEITPFKRNPEVYFYEIGEHTDFKVVEPETKLMALKVNSENE